MALPPRLSVPLLLVAAALIVSPAHALQEPCRAPAPSIPREPNIFTETQEVDLGDAVADHQYRQVRLIGDSGLTDRLREVGALLINHLPPSTLKFEFLLIDSPEATAFVLPGGRIFVSRKLVAFARNEDELAGVLAHEIGHLVARHHSIVMTRWFREALDVTSVTDRRDIVEKYNRLQNNLHRIKPDAKGLHSNEGQIEADRLGVFLTAAAGYDPDGLATFLERLTEASPDDGGFFSDLFGRTSPDVRRLRALVGAQAALMKSCTVAKRPASTVAFGQWQKALVAYTGLNLAESLGAGVISRTTLRPAIRGDLSALRFSPDGRLILAQDNAGIAVLTRDPLRVIFSVDIPGARRPRFSPDSSRLVVHTDDLRVLTWHAGTGQLESAHEIVVPVPCASADLSPDGRVLACFDLNAELSMYDVATNTRLFEKKRFPPPRVVTSSFGFYLRGLRRTGVSIAFSPNGRYFAAAYHEQGEFGIGIPDVDEAVVYDLIAKVPVEISGGVRRLLSGGVSFLGDNRLLALNFREPAKSGVVALPSGEVQETVPLVRGDIEAASHGLFAVLRPFQKFAAAVLDLRQGRIAKTSANSAVDRYDDVILAERGTGEVALYAAAGNTPLAAVTLPPGDLGDLTGLSVSPDLQRVAISTPARGAIWDLAGGRGEAMMPPFTGGAFADDGRMYADFLPWNGQPRQIAGVDARAGRIDRVGVIDVSRAFYVAQVGTGVVTVRPANGSRYDTNVVVEMRDAASLAEPRWTKTYKGLAPRIASDLRRRSLALFWPTETVNGRDRLKDAPDLLRRFDAMKNTPGTFLVEVYDAATGASQGTLLVALGHATVGIASVSVAGDHAVFADTRNRIHMYSLSTGEVRGQLFGQDPTVAPRGDLMAVENGSGRLFVYDVATLGLRAELQFRRSVTMAAFNETSTELLVVTSDQSVTRLAVPAAR